MSDATRRVSDAVLREWVEVAGGSREGGMAAELLTLRAAIEERDRRIERLAGIVRDVAAIDPLDREWWACFYCGTEAENQEDGPVLILHTPDCPYRRAAEWAKGAGDE